MLRYFLGVIAILLAIVVALGYFAKADPKRTARTLKGLGGVALMVLALVMVARGLFVYAVPIAWFGYSLLRGRAPFPSSFPGTANKSTGQQSRVWADFIEMRLDHDTGDMEGMVLKGAYEGRFLSDMPLDDLLKLLSECRASDEQAAQLLMAYLDRAHEEWRERSGVGDEEPSSGAGGGPMSVAEAYEILGLEPNASHSDIHKAHRKLMKRLHPDQGGSTYLAARVNEAKDLLLGK